MDGVIDKHGVGDKVKTSELIAKADKQQQDMVLLDSITGAIYEPNTNGVTGYVARAVAPQVSYQIGQYFKENHGEGTAPHILAHGILAAAVSAATGNDVTTGALSVMGAEAAAKPLARFLFKTDVPSKLTVEQKETLSSITSLAGLGLGASTGSVTNAVNAAETGKVAVEDNYWVNFSSISRRNKAAARKQFNLNKDRFNAKCKTAGGDCNDVIEKMLNFVNDPFVKGVYNSLRAETLRVLRNNPELVLTYFNSQQYKLDQADKSILNRYVGPIMEVAGGGFGVAGSIGGTAYACTQTVGVGCYAAAILGSAGAAGSYDHVRTCSQSFQQ